MTPNDLKALYESGKSLAAIAEITGKSRGSIHYQLLKSGAELRKHGKTAEDAYGNEQERDFLRRLARKGRMELQQYLNTYKLRKNWGDINPDKARGYASALMGKEGV